MPKNRELLSRLHELIDRLEGGDLSARLSANGDEPTAVDATIDRLIGTLLARPGAFPRGGGETAASESTQRSTARLQQIVDQSPVGIAIYDPSGQCTLVNDAICQHVGATREQMLAQNYKELASWKAAGLLAVVERVASERVPGRHDLTGKSSFGREIYLDCQCIPLGREHVLVTALDITERKCAELALAESEAQLSHSQRVAQLGSYVLDVTAGCWESSEILDEIFGLPADFDKLTEQWLLIVAPEDREEMGAYLAEHVLARGNRFDREYRIRRLSDGAERWVHGLGELSLDDDGTPLLMIGTIQDITERKLAEQKQAHLEAQLHQAQKMEVIGRLAGGVAHDFNNMLSVILGSAELVLDVLEDDHPAVADIHELEKAALRSRDITRQLLAFSRKELIAPRVLDLDAVVHETLGALGRLIGEDVRLRFFPGEGRHHVLFDKSQLDQILVNLGANARDAMPKGGTLTIETTRRRVDEAGCAGHLEMTPGDYAILIVSDDGMGMKPDVLEHIFEPFYTTKGRAEGTGLGLATVYGVVRQNGGFINVYSEQGRGTTFKIYFPEAVGELATEQSIAPATKGSGAVLVVEDDPMVQRVAKAMLRSLGYTAIIARSSRHALEICEGDEPVAVVLTDVVMPEISGFEVRDRISKLRPGVPLIFMSGYTANVIVNQGPSGREGPGLSPSGREGPLGDEIFLQKPFSKRDLAEKLALALATRQTVG